MLMRVVSKTTPLQHRSNRTRAKTSAIEKIETRTEEVQLVPLLRLAQLAQETLLRKARTTAGRLKTLMELRPNISQKRTREALLSSKP